MDLYGLSEEDVVVFTSGGIVATGNKKILYPGDIADGATLGKIVPKFEVQKKTSVLKIKRLRTRNNHENGYIVCSSKCVQSYLSRFSKKNSAIEPPIWAGMLANSVRRNGFSPEILDAEVLGLNYENVHVKRSPGVQGTSYLFRGLWSTTECLFSKYGRGSRYC